MIFEMRRPPTYLAGMLLAVVAGFGLSPASAQDAETQSEEVGYLTEGDGQALPDGTLSDESGPIEEVISADDALPEEDDGDYPEELDPVEGDAIIRELLGLAEEDEAPIVDRFIAHEAFMNYYETKQYEQAIDAAQLVVQLTEEEFGPDHPELISPYNNLATALAYHGNYKLAETRYLRSVSLIENNLGIFHDRMINPLKGLGVIYNYTGRHQQGLSTFRRAQHIAHRNEGVLALSQIEIVDGISESHMGLLKFREAEDSQLFALKVAENHYGEGSVESVPALYKLARWYFRVGDFPRARDRYEQAVEILEEGNGPNDLSLVKALRGVAATHRVEIGARKGKGEDALRRVLRILEENEEADSADLLAARLELADWMMVFSKTADAIHEYRVAWTELEDNTSEPEASQGQLEEVFGVPRRLTGGTLLPADLVGNSLEEDVQPFAEFQFTVTETGRLRDITVRDSNLSPRARTWASRVLRSARYRPRFEDGEPVATDGMVLRQIY